MYNLLLRCFQKTQTAAHNLQSQYTKKDNQNWQLYESQRRWKDNCFQRKHSSNCCRNHSLCIGATVCYCWYLFWTTIFKVAYLDSWLFTTNRIWSAVKSNNSMRRAVNSLKPILSNSQWCCEIVRVNVILKKGCCLWCNNTHIRQLRRSYHQSQNRNCVSLECYSNKVCFAIKSGSQTLLELKTLQQNLPFICNNGVSPIL